MGLLDALPKNPKISDLVTLLGELDNRITELETLSAEIVRERTARIEQLEHAIEQHQAGATERQRELDRVKSDTRRLRWTMSHGRRP
jgi:multidrug resistance efflux pump